MNRKGRDRTEGEEQKRTPRFLSKPWKISLLDNDKHSGVLQDGREPGAGFGCSGLWSPAGQEKQQAEGCLL
jgi:hypothetical protein